MNEMAMCLPLLPPCRSLQDRVCVLRVSALSDRDQSTMGGGGGRRALPQGAQSQGTKAVGEIKNHILSL